MTNRRLPAGTYAGDGSGKYTMVCSRDAAKKIAGTVDRRGYGDSMTCTWKTANSDTKNAIASGTFAGTKKR